MTCVTATTGIRMQGGLPTPTEIRTGPVQAACEENHENTAVHKLNSKIVGYKYIP